MLDILCTAVLRDGHKLYRHFKTIDHPVKRYFIIDNSCGEDKSVSRAIDRIFDEQPDHIKEISVLETLQNTGFSGAVNLSVKQNTDCNYWIFTGFDWYPAPGEFKRLDESISQYKNGMVLGVGNDEMCGIVLTPKSISEIGLMDENFHPGYYEDNDYRYRQTLSGTYLTPFPLLNQHVTSSTLHSSPTFEKKNKETFSKNFDYYLDKWGGSPGKEVYTTPFNSGYPVDYWKYDPVRVESLHWN